jgi:hypothetical protein
MVRATIAGFPSFTSRRIDLSSRLGETLGDRDAALAMFAGRRTAAALTGDPR